MKLIIFTLCAFACAFVLGGYYVKKNTVIPKPIIKHIVSTPTFIEEQTQPASTMSLFKDMFWKVNPWDTLHPQSTYLKVGRQQPLILGGRPKNVIIGSSTNRDDYLNTSL